MKENIFNEFAKQLAQQAGAIISTNFSSGMRKEWKGDGTPLTATDLAVNQLVIDSVSENFPSHGVIGEEGSYGDPSSRFCWICDPVDGTIPFSHAIPTSVFSLALCEDGEPIIAVVMDPFLNRLFFAELGRGASLNGSPIKVGAFNGFKNTLMCICGPVGLFDQFAVSKEVAIRGALNINLASIVYAGMLTASGEIAATAFTGTNPWDSAAMSLLISEAGGKVSNIAGDSQRYDRQTLGFVGAAKEIHDELLEIINTHQL